MEYNFLTRKEILFLDALKWLQELFLIRNIRYKIVPEREKVLI